MMKMAQEDRIICAPATSGGGAIALIRVSGEGAVNLVAKIFQPADNEVNIICAKGYRMFYGTISSQGRFLDQVIIAIFRAPNSYTGDEMVEISCHASPFIQYRIMELLIEGGAEAASPGEFTMRAFMNGKMDLSQAEAVADIIAADSEAAHRLASSQLRGGFSRGIEQLRQELLSFVSLIELELDFSEEDVEFADRFAMTNTVIRIKDSVDTLSSSFRLGNAIRRGIPVVIAGKPNVGKSSLLNLLLSEERAIVSDIPGTTRDTVEEVIHLGGFLYRFIDTAGLRPTADQLEEMGMARTRRSLQEADIIVAVAEATDDTDTITGIVSSIDEITGESGAAMILVVNKRDLISASQSDQLKSKLEQLCSVPVLLVSATQSTGIDELQQQLIASVDRGRLENPHYIVTNVRHFEALTKVSQSLQRVLDGFSDGIPTVLIATDIRQAVYYLGQITGQITPDDILGEIFSRFCIGK